VRALSADGSIGLRAEVAASLDAPAPYRYCQSEVFGFLEVVALVGAEGSPEYPELVVSGRQRAALALLPHGCGWLGGLADTARAAARWVAALARSTRVECASAGYLGYRHGCNRRGRGRNDAAGLGVGPTVRAG
jgi:hypothetical protein